MKAYNIILIQIICLFSSFSFSQLTPQDLMVKREVETLRQLGRESIGLSTNRISTDYADTLITSKYSQHQSESSDEKSLDYYGYNILTTFPE